MSAQPKHLLKPHEYLHFERTAPEKHEYFEGELFTMAGASFRHTVISTNIVAALRSPLRKRGCTVHANDLRTKTQSGLYTYPDIVVVCGKPEFLDNEFDTLLNPVCIIEILSDSTKHYDRTTKFDQYRTIPSLQEYVLVEQDTMRVERYTRINNNAANETTSPEQTLWSFQAITDVQGALWLTALDGSISIAEVYDTIAFEEPAQ